LHWRKANGRSNRAAVFVFKSQKAQMTASRIEMTARRIEMTASRIR
jgi:hypothetical protein